MKKSIFNFNELHNMTNAINDGVLFCYENETIKSIIHNICKFSVYKSYTENGYTKNCEFSDNDGTLEIELFNSCVDYMYKKLKEYDERLCILYFKVTCNTFYYVVYKMVVDEIKHGLNYFLFQLKAWNFKNGCNKSYNQIEKVTRYADNDFIYNPSNKDILMDSKIINKIGRNEVNKTTRTVGTRENGTTYTEVKQGGQLHNVNKIEKNCKMASIVDSINAFYYGQHKNTFSLDELYDVEYIEKSSNDNNIMILKTLELFFNNRTISIVISDYKTNTDSQYLYRRKKEFNLCNVTNAQLKELYYKYVA